MRKKKSAPWDNQTWVKKSTCVNRSNGAKGNIRNIYQAWGYNTRYSPSVRVINAIFTKREGQQKRKKKRSTSSQLDRTRLFNGEFVLRSKELRTTIELFDRNVDVLTSLKYKPLPDWKPVDAHQGLLFGRLCKLEALEEETTLCRLSKGLFVGLGEQFKATFWAHVTGNGSRLSCFGRTAFNRGCGRLERDERLELEVW